MTESELAFGALYYNYLFVGTVIRTSISFAVFFGPGLVLTGIGFGCSHAWDAWSNRRTRRAAIRQQVLDLLDEPAAPSHGPRIDTRPGTDQQALATCRAIDNSGTANRRNPKGESA